MEKTPGVLEEILQERASQQEKWGEQNHYNGPVIPKRFADQARESCEATFAAGKGSWSDILHEEFWEAMVECDDDSRLREELIQVAAVAVAWIECIDRRWASRG